MNMEKSEIVLKIQNFVAYWKINKVGTVNISIVDCFFTINVLCEKECVSKNLIIKFDSSN